MTVARQTQNVGNRVIFVSYKLANWLFSLPMLVTNLISCQLSSLFMKNQITGSAPNMNITLSVEEFC